MPYRADFYVVGNIVGYTGVIGAAPSVYFQTAAESGHITQAHNNANNIGRGPVRARPANAIANEMILRDGAMVLRLVERRNGVIFHVSRNAMIPLANFGPNDLALLAPAIVNFPNIKPKYA